MARYGLVIDLDRCVGCHTCAVSCRAAWEIPPPNARLRIHALGPARTSEGLAATFTAQQCVHCRQPACVAVCPVAKEERTLRDPNGFPLTVAVAATWRDPATGVVRIDGDRCIGCGSCVDACPYQARFLAGSGLQRRADGCDFCLELLEKGGTEPACVAACVTGARLFGDLDDPASPVARRLANGPSLALEPAGVAAGPQLFYVGRGRDLELVRSHGLPGPAAAAGVATRRRLLGRLAHLTR